MAHPGFHREGTGEPHDESRNNFQEVFLVALLLSGSVTNAECAMLKGISTLGNSNMPVRALLDLILRAAAAPDVAIGQMEKTPSLYVSCLPIELRRVLLLPEDPRRCFVLHLLIGLPLSSCSRLLSMSDYQIRRNTIDAVLQLTGMGSPSVARDAPSRRTTGPCDCWARA